MHWLTSFVAFTLYPDLQIDAHFHGAACARKGDKERRLVRKWLADEASANNVCFVPHEEGIGCRAPYECYFAVMLPVTMSMKAFLTKAINSSGPTAAPLRSA